MNQKHHIVSLPPAHNSLADEYQIIGGQATLGFISPLSHSFCRGCNRLRLTADGFLKPCLASKYEVNIKVPVRAGHAGNELRRVFYEAMRLKPKAHKMDQGSWTIPDIWPRWEDEILIIQNKN